MICNTCGKTDLYLLFDGECRACFDLRPKQILSLPKGSKAEFDIDVNARRKKARIRKALIAGKAKLRRCDECGKDYYATRAIQRFCTKDCKRKKDNRRYRDRKRANK